MSSSMIKIARKNVKNNRINFKLKNLHLLKDNKKYDLIFSLFHVLSYQTQKKTINNFFRVINSIMKKIVYLFLIFGIKVEFLNSSLVKE